MGAAYGDAEEAQLGGVSILLVPEFVELLTGPLLRFHLVRMTLKVRMGSNGASTPANGEAQSSRDRHRLRFDKPQ
jgi:hypothetical protein